MSEKQETVADISAWARGLVKPGETLNNTYELLNGLADRYEAAHKRDIEAYDLINFMSPVGRVKPAPSGNGAKTHEALKQILAIAKANGLFEIQSLAETALDEPARNCDRFGCDPKNLHDEWWKWSGDRKNRNADGTVKLTYGEWLLAEAKGDAK